MEPQVRRALDAISRKDWEELRSMLHVNMRWLPAAGPPVLGRDNVLDKLMRGHVPMPPDSVELRDGQVYRWTEPE